MELKIIFTTPSSYKCGAHLIRMWINKPYSHVALNFRDSSRDLIWQASHGVVHLIEKSNFLLDNKIVKEYKLDITENQKELLKDFCYDTSGETYAYSQLAHIVLFDILKKFKIPFITPNDKGFICSELVSEALTILFGYDLPKQTWLMRPDDVDNLLERLLTKL